MPTHPSQATIDRHIANQTILAVLKKALPKTLPEHQQAETMARQRYNLRSSTKIYKTPHGDMTTPATASASHRYHLRSSPKTSNPTIPFDLTALPPEIRLRILSHALTNAAGHSGTISVSPRAIDMPESDTITLRQDAANKWTQRRGILHASRQLREEALEVLYREHTFSAHMTVSNDPDGSDCDAFDRLRFERWIDAAGDVEARRVRRVRFAVAWPAVRTANGDWIRRRAEVGLFFSPDGRVRVEVRQSKPDASAWERPTERLGGVETHLRNRLLGGARKVEEGFALDCRVWMAVWDGVADFVRYHL